MKRDHPLLAVVLLFLFMRLASITAAAQAQSDDKVDLRYRQTLTGTQIEQVTNDLAKDATVFQPVDRAILWARIGDLPDTSHALPDEFVQFQFQPRSAYQPQPFSSQHDRPFT